MIGGKLHDKGRGIPLKAFCLFQDQATEKNGGNADQVCGGRNERRLSPEGNACDKTDQRKLCSAGDTKEMETGPKIEMMPICKILKETEKLATMDKPFSWVLISQINMP